MSLDYYERQFAKTELYQKLNDARSEIAHGAKGKNAKSVLSNLISK